MNNSSRIPLIRLDKEQSSSKNFEDAENICRVVGTDPEEERKEEEESRSRKKRLANFLNSTFIKKQ